MLNRLFKHLANEWLLRKIRDPYCHIRAFRDLIAFFDKWDLYPDKMIFSKVKNAQNNKEKLFCLDCYLISKNNATSPIVAELLYKLQLGDYKIEIPDQNVVKEIFLLLNFTSRIFIEEKNLYFRKLKANN